jgi:hypothetical protein
MNIQSELNTYNRALQKVEYDLEWSQEQADLVRRKLERQIYREKVKSRAFKIFGYVSTISLTFSFLFLLIIQLGNEDSFVSGMLLNNEKLYTMEVIDGKERPVLTEKGMEYVVYPMDAYKEINTISGEPLLGVSVGKIGSKEQIYTQAFYPTSEGRFISVHYSKNETGSVEEMSRYFFPEYPLYGTKITEINVSGQRAFLHEPTTEYGSAALYIVTKKYVYYMTNHGLLDKQQGDSEELVRLANLFNFEAER